MNRIIFVMALLLLSGCDPVVRSSVLHSEVKMGLAHCSHIGYCMGCGMDFHGHLNCGPKFRPSCPGTQNAKLRIDTVEMTYQSGKRNIVEQSEVLERYGSCQ